MKDFNNKKVVITGGASGIGLATAKKILRGWRSSFNYRTESTKIGKN